ncbi:MAG: Lrp/AsnC family transcriptional regulator [Planctomycetes bacterium]|nr:Lrp/AsnC family transcriptional regulator [Planctomycetota bacterium]
MSASLDPIDLRILQLLQPNARISNADVARELSMAPSAILERIRKLEQRGLIQAYETRVEPRKVGLSLTAFVFVRADEPPAGGPTIGDQLAALPELLEVHQVAGEDCYLVKLRARDTDDLARVLSQRIGGVRGVRSTRTTIVLATHKETACVPLAHPEARDE